MIREISRMRSGGVSRLCSCVQTCGDAHTATHAGSSTGYFGFCAPERRGEPFLYATDHGKQRIHAIDAGSVMAAFTPSSIVSISSYRRSSMNRPYTCQHVRT